MTDNQGDDDNQAYVKIIVVGDSGSGKTSYVNMFTKGIFEESYKPTIVTEFGFKIVEVGKRLCRVQLWDLAGQDKNSSTITRVFAKDAHGFITLCDATDKGTREK